MHWTNIFSLVFDKTQTLITPNFNDNFIFYLTASKFTEHSKNNGGDANYEQQKSVRLR